MLSPILAVLAVAALGLWLLLPGGALRAQDAAIEHAENGKGTVATFTATDPEGVTPITWGLLDPNVTLPTGITAADVADFADFEIDDEDGELKFSSSSGPDFENPMGSNSDNTACDVTVTPIRCTNTYKVVVTASDGSETGYEKVTVKVTNVAETGKVTWIVDPDGAGTLEPNDPDATPSGKPIVQFQVGALLTASVTDGDVSGPAKDTTTGATWRWHRSSSKTSTGTMIEGADEATYTVTTADVGMHLRAMAHYVVTGNVDQETASLTSDHPVLAVRAGNNKLKFDPAAVDRKVAEGKEGANVGAPVTATGNHGAVNYTFVTDGDAERFKIDQKTGQITTAVDLDYDAAGDADNCRDTTGQTPHCTVTVRATDASGDGTGVGTNTDAIVTIKVTDVNEKPKFITGTAETRIEVPENNTGLSGTADGYSTEQVGDVTYMAEDQENQSLTYRLMGTDGAAKFELSATQVLSFKTRPDYENPTDRNRDNVYEVTVRASDGTLYADRMVKVTVTNVDDAPEVSGPSSKNFAENGKGTVATFTATDPEGVTPITWSVLAADATNDIRDVELADAADADHFDISKEGELTFDIGGDGDTPDKSEPPDFENPPTSNDIDNTYKVVVAASDGDVTGYHKVTVKVTNVDETGKVTWDVDHNADGNANMPKLVQFQVGASLTASVTDGDIEGGTKTVPTPTWRWYRGAAEIDGQTSATYVVTTADVGKRLRVTATYRVGGATTQESPSLTSDYPVLAERPGDNKLKFDPSAVSRSVAESKKGANVGAPVTATGNHGVVNYTLVTGVTTVDDGNFEIDQKTGQITTAVDLNFDMEDAANCRDDDFCTVTVRATDATGDATGTAADNPPVFADATVTIKVTDVNEKPTFVTVDPNNRDIAWAIKAIKVPEKDTALSGLAVDGYSANLASSVEVTYAATDPEGLNVNLTLMGTDGAKFALSAGDVLSFREKPDYEKPTDGNRDNVYEVTIRASDGTLYADRMVKVTVTDVDEAPEIIAGGLSISGPSSVSYAEDGTDLVVATYSLAGPESDSGRWTLGGDDAGDFRISNSGVLSFRSSPNYEAPADKDMDNVYMVTLNARDREPNTATREVTVRVTDVVEDVPVIGDDTLLGKFDANTNGQIDKSEVVDAIIAFVTPGASNKPSKEDIVDLIVHFVTTPR